MNRYTIKEVDKLQEILFYRELGIELSQIEIILDNPKMNRKSRLELHLKKLMKRRKDLNILIKNVEDTIDTEEGENNMNDDKKFEGLKKNMLDENEKEFGHEIRQKWDNKFVDESNKKMMKMSKNDFEDLKKIGEEINKRLEDAVKSKLNPGGDEGRKIGELHKKWLSYSWPEYDADSHRGLVEMYLSDGRFKKYYDTNVEGCAKFLRDAVISMSAK